MPNSRRVVAFLLLVTLLAAACAGPAPSVPPTGSPATSSNPLSGTLTVYSGRSKTLVEPLIERFRAATGLEVAVEYAGTSELAATILEEGDRSPADVFFAQDAGALGAIAAAGRFATLSDATLERVEARFRSTDGLWVGVSGRARVVAYDSRVLTPADLPTSILGFADPQWKGRIGWAPTNASFQAFVTGFRILKGDAAAKAWLEGIQANEPKAYEGNDAVLAAIAAGEVEVGFVNHYYALRQAAEQGETYPVFNRFMSGGDVGALINVAGAGILKTAPNPDAARAFVDFLLSDESQHYFAEETLEYPLVAGVPSDPRVVPLAEIEAPDIDLSQLADLSATLRLIQEAGVL